MNNLERIANGIDSFSEGLGRSVAWLMLAMVGVASAVVLLRYGFDRGWIAMQESVTYMHGIALMLAAGYTFKHDAHVRVDIFYRQRTARYQAWTNLVGGLIFLLPLCGFIFFVSLDYVTTAWQLKESSREAGGLPWVYLLKSCILLLSLTLALQGISSICRSLILILSHKSRS